MTIEEAWKRLQHHLHEYSHDVGVDACNKHVAARALALAVLEEMIVHEELGTRACGHGEGGAACFDWFRARIEALGRAEDAA